MTTALATLVRTEITPTEWEMINQIAPVMHGSRLFGVGSPAAAAAIMLKGRELGLPLTASFDLIHIIDNKPGLSPRGALAILHSSPEIRRIDIRELLDEKGVYQGHECTIERVNGFAYTARFTIQDAERAGLVKPNSGWAKYPRNMCLWRAVGFAADVVAPDIIGGMKTADQYGAAIDAQGDIIPGQWVDGGDAPPVMQLDESADIAAFAQTLIDEYDADKVLAANGGQIPTTLEEVDAARYALIALDDEVAS